MNKLVIIKIDSKFNFVPYLGKFPEKVRIQIMAYYHHKDRIIAFTSALLKYYYLPQLVNIEPELEFTSYGKPYYKNCPQVDFSISHSGEYVVAAIGKNVKIGVDIEFIDKDVDLSVGSVIFSNSERSYLNTYIDFFTLWTKKEAYLKCLGTGFMKEPLLETTFNNSHQEKFDSYQLQTITFDNNYILSVCTSR